MPAIILVRYNVVNTSLSQQYIATISNNTIMTKEKRKRIIRLIEVLYQFPPKPYNTYVEQPNRKDWTDSLETYENAARKQYNLLKANPRTAWYLITPHNPVHLITIKYFRKFNNLEIIALWEIIRAYLKEHGIIAFGVIEITTRRHYVSDKEFYDYPTRRCHYHIFVANEFAETRLRRKLSKTTLQRIPSVATLRDIFNNACIEAGLSNKRPDKDFEVHYESITNPREFLRKCMYVLKYKIYKHQAILFKKYTGINKIFSINGWFNKVDDHGKKINKEQMWDDLIDEWYPKESTTTQRQPYKFTFQFSIPCSGVLGILSSILRKENSHEE